MKKSIKLSLLAIVATNFSMCSKAPQKETTTDIKSTPKLIYVVAFTSSGDSIFSPKTQIK